MKKVTLLLALILTTVLTFAKNDSELELKSTVSFVESDSVRVTYYESTDKDNNLIRSVFVEKGTGFRIKPKSGDVKKSWYVKNINENYSMTVKRKGVVIQVLSKEQVGNPSSYLHDLPSENKTVKKMYKKSLDEAKLIFSENLHIIKGVLKGALDRDFEEFKLALENKKCHDSFISGTSQVLTHISRTKNVNVKGIFQLENSGSLALSFREGQYAPFVQLSKMKYSTKQKVKDLTIFCELNYSNLEPESIEKILRGKWTLKTIGWQNKVKKAVRKTELKKLENNLK